jgi:cell division protein FtsB
MSWEQDPWMNPEFRMARRSQQRDWRTGRKRVITILACTIVVYAVYLLVGGEFGIWRLHALQKEETRLTGEIAIAQERVDLLKRDLANIDETREREAREGFGMAKPNELIYEIGPADSVTSGTQAPEAVRSRQEPVRKSPAPAPVKAATPAKKRPAKGHR